MPQITVADETFRRLSERAAALNVTVEDLVGPTLERLAGPGPSQPLTGDAWQAEWDTWRRDAEGRAHRYPPGFVLDDSRETLYADREDAQRCSSSTRTSCSVARVQRTLVCAPRHTPPVKMGRGSETPEIDERGGPCDADKLTRGCCGPRR